MLIQIYLFLLANFISKFLNDISSPKQTQMIQNKELITLNPHSHS